ncbi:DWNN domain a CCHC-type zinc finger [Senna tora]|uniref:DWNN domain a CCHC-type zinc finger n=1 Tax=Senna tora TaxID=362788 RepID=A0A834WA18_9FABA|nr:DWNN domain a CCHC-type zinc finger [Senna tora]
MITFSSSTHPPIKREGPEWNVFGGDLYETSSTKKEYKWPKEPPPGYVCHKCFVPGHFIHHCPKSKRDYYEDSKNKAIMECRPKVPPQGYLCDRCKVPGHYISRCPTNGNPKFDMIKRVIKPPPPASTSNGNNNNNNNNNLQEIILCPLCNHVMKDAAQTKCCFRSFCDKCIREYINRFKSICVCGANIVEDDIMPNRTLREAINRMDLRCLGVSFGKMTPPALKDSSYVLEKMKSYFLREKNVLLLCWPHKTRLIISV